MCFAFFCVAIGIENSIHPPNQGDIKPKLIATCSLAFPALFHFCDLSMAPCDFFMPLFATQGKFTLWVEIILFLHSQKRKKATDSGKSAKKYKEFKFWEYVFPKHCFSFICTVIVNTPNLWFQTFIALTFFKSYLVVTNTITLIKTLIKKRRWIFLSYLSGNS